MNYIFYSCILEGRQLCFEEPYLLAAPEAVRAVCKAGFQNSSDYEFECVQPPKDGMFLFKVTRKTDGFLTLVFFDTRTRPNFIWVENVFDNELDITVGQFVNMVEMLLGSELHKHGWKVRLNKFLPRELQDIMLFHDAVEYVNAYQEKDVFVNKVAFRAIVISDAIADEVMALIKKYMKGKNKPRTLIAPLKAARVAGAVIKVTKAMYKKIFGNILGSSISSVDRYMSDDYEWNPKDTVFKKMYDEFVILVNKTKTVT